MDWCRKWLVDFNAGKNSTSFDCNNIDAIDVKIDGSVLEDK